ncbi:hypothetical protein VZT92_024165 [Zoarces viviparus]|uniref:Uncharacterized protein n=1 Tax=Zoarces viviparus TaxID=48416 RepID=A0AAW1E2D2_ZOAVI
MIDNEVVLEALRVLCSEGLTSTQSQGFNVCSAVADVSGGAVLQASWQASWSPKLGNEILDPRFNYDFSNLKDTEKYYRGGEEYKRPCGWQRFALKVLDKYEDNTWLGNMNRETESVPGEWPVSYHGTQEQYVKAITEENYKPGPRQLYGQGVYSTPDIKIAKDFATGFSWKGQKYKTVFQNRINPKYREICNSGKYWLVPIKDKRTTQEIVNKAIRPYGLLVIKV